MSYKPYHAVPLWKFLNLQVIYFVQRDLENKASVNLCTGIVWSPDFTQKNLYWDLSVYSVPLKSPTWTQWMTKNWYLHWIGHEQEIQADSINRTNNEFKTIFFNNFANFLHLMRQSCWRSSIWNAALPINPF